MFFLYFFAFSIVEILESGNLSQAILFSFYVGIMKLTGPLSDVHMKLYKENFVHIQ
jgi:hypothetical protein